MSDKLVNKPRQLTLENQADFFATTEKGEVFVYSEALNFEDVMQLAVQSGWLIVYEAPGSNNYEKYGCFACRVFAKVREPQQPVEEEVWNGKFQITFKDPDGVWESLHADGFDPDGLLPEMQSVLDKFIKWGEYITVEFDTETQTARVLPNK